MEILFVRHGQPRWSHRGAADIDPGLTDLGWAQARAVADRLAEVDGITEIIVSPARRARETAKPIAERLGHEPTIVDEITEMRAVADEWHDSPAELVEQMFRESRDRPLEEWWDGFPGGESFRDFHARVCAAFDRLLAARGVTRAPDPHLWEVDPDPGRIVVVAHAGTNSVALGHLLGLEPTPWEWERFASPHASLATVRSVPLARRTVLALYSFADTAHIEAGSVTY